MNGQQPDYQPVDIQTLRTMRWIRHVQAVADIRSRFGIDHTPMNPPEGVPFYHPPQPAPQIVPPVQTAAPDFWQEPLTKLPDNTLPATPTPSAATVPGPTSKPPTPVIGAV